MEFLKKIVEFCKDNVLMTCITALAALFVVLLVVLAAVLSNKAKKAKRALEEREKAKANAKANEPVTERKAEEPVKEEPKKESVKAEPVRDEKIEKKIEKKPEEKPEEKIVEEPVEPVPAPVVLEKPTQKAEKKTLAEELNETEQAADFYEEDETEKQSRYAGKWQICRIVTDEEEEEETYFFELRASNGELLLSSEEYTSYAGAMRGIQTHKANILRNNFKIALTKKGDYVFKLLSGKNLLLCTGANYPTRARCESAVASVRRFAETAVLDENLVEHVVKPPHEDDTPVLPLADGCVGKWLVETLTGENGETLYYFELYANNGERLLSSEEYTTYIGAINGIQTYKKNVSAGNFRISLTKRGDYIFKLLNGNGQLLCLGEHYKSKRLCQSAVQSVKRFALASPTLTASSNIEG